MNHSAAPINPPAAAAVSGTATPLMPASTIRLSIGRLLTMPVPNCGASRVNVAAAVKVSAPSAPIMKPSNASRVGGRSSRTITAGISIRITPPSGIADAVAQHAGPDHARAQRNSVRPGHRRARQQHPADPQPDAQRRGEHPCARGDVGEPVGLAQIEQEQERKAQRRNGDQRGGQPQQRERNQRYEYHRQPDPEHHA